MKRFKIGIARINCPRCKNASIETMISGKQYNGGELGYCVRSEEHDMCYFKASGPATPEQIEATKKKLEQMGWSLKKPAMQKPVAPVIPRDPSQSQQEWHDREDDEDHEKDFKPAFDADDEDPYREVERENMAAVEERNRNEDL